MIVRITKEDTLGGARGKFVWHGGGEVWIASTTENPKSGIGWRGMKKGLVWCKVVEGCGG